jgi:hypothetical protein
VRTYFRKISIKPLEIQSLSIIFDGGKHAIICFAISFGFADIWIEYSSWE